MTFKPRKNSRVAALIEYLTTNPEVVSMSTAAIAEQFDLEAKVVGAYMKPAVVAGVLVKAKVEGSYAYGLAGVFTPEEPQAGEGESTTEEEPEKFCAALDTEGDLFMRGALACEGGGVLLRKTQAAELREYLLHTGSWLDIVVSPAK